MISLFALLLCACGSELPAPPPDSSPAFPEVEAVSSEASWTAAEVADILAEQLGDLPDPNVPFETYLELMAAGDENCPGDLYQILDEWLLGCDSTTGYHYAGVTQYMDEELHYDGEVALLSGVAGDFWIDTPEGHTLEAGGHSLIAQMDSGWLGEIKGSWTWTGGDPWLATGFSGIYSVEFRESRGLFIQGALDMVGVYFGLEAFALDADCEWGPSEGGLRLRDPSGGWYALEFDQCDPCTDVSFEGVSLGEACVDFGPMRAHFGVENP